MKIQLSLHKDYVSEWDVSYAVREIVQNIIDNPSANIIGVENGVLYLGNEEGLLNKSSLLLGNSSKKDSNNIGKFGEGYKLALLVLLRKGIKTTIYTGNEIWTPHFEKHDIFDEYVLTINIEESKEIYNGILFKIEGIKGNIHLILDSVLINEDRFDVISTSKKGNILKHKNSDDRGKIFVNGMFITQIYNFSYSYNFKPDILVLGRDRNIVNESHVVNITSELWTLSSRYDLFMELIKKQARDIGWIDMHSHKIAKEVMEDLALQYENIIPVCYNDDIKSIEKEFDTRKYSFKSVAPFMMNVIPKKVLVKKVLPKKEILYNKIFYEKYHRQFTKQMKKDWSKLNNKLKEV